MGRPVLRILACRRDSRIETVSLSETKTLMHNPVPDRKGTDDERRDIRVCNTIHGGNA